MSKRLVIISNRIPTDSAPSGGLVFALHETLQRKGGIWVGTRQATNASLASSLTPVPTQENYERLLFDLTPDDHKTFYLGFSNSVLWPVCHRRGDLVDLNRVYEEGYIHVNARLARQLYQTLRDDDLVWVHDYHFFPLAAELRKLGFRGKIGFFLHIPFPAVGDLGALPAQINLAEWLSEYNLVGLQTRADVARCLEMYRADERAELMIDGEIKYRDRLTALRSFPIGIDVDTFTKHAAQPLKRELQRSLPKDMAIGVDRLDYSKGLPNRFRAFGRFLEQRPNISIRPSLLQIAPPTREEVPAYRNIRLELEELAGRLNGENAELDWTPLRYIHRNVDRTLLAGLYRHARVGFVTPFADGMNLVAKEYIAAQNPEDPGVLVLSRMAGAAEDLIHAVLVNPYDVEEMSDALLRAFNMPIAERIQRYRACMAQVIKTDVNGWSDRFLAMLDRCTSSLLWNSPPSEDSKVL